MTGLQNRFDELAIQLCNEKGLRLTDNFENMREKVKNDYYNATQEHRDKLIKEWDEAGL